MYGGHSGWRWTYSLYCCCILDIVADLLCVCFTDSTVTTSTHFPLEIFPVDSFLWCFSAMLIFEKLFSIKCPAYFCLHYSTRQLCCLQENIADSDTSDDPRHRFFATPQADECSPGVPSVGAKVMKGSCWTGKQRKLFVYKHARYRRHIIIALFLGAVTKQQKPCLY